MSANGAILEPKFHPFIHLGLSWPKSLFIGIDRRTITISVSVAVFPLCLWVVLCILSDTNSQHDNSTIVPLFNLYLKPNLFQDSVAVQPLN